MSNLRIAVLHHARSFFPLDLFERTRQTADLIWVLDDAFSDDTITRRLLKRLGMVVDIAGLDDDAAAEAIALASPDGILSFVDDQIPRAAALASRLGLRYHTPELAHVLTDKGEQRAVLGTAGVPQPWFVSVPAHSSRDELAVVPQQLVFPCVVKPASGMASRGIRLIHTSEEFVALAGSESDHVVEEYLRDRDGLPPWAGSYLSVETVVVGGRPRHIALTGRFPVAAPFRETGNFIPAIADADTRSRVIALADDVVKALGVQDSLLHIEIKLTPSGPRLIEVNGRLGGRPGFVLSEVSNVNLFAVACKVAAGTPVDLEDVAPVDGVGFWLMFQPPMSATSLVATEGVDEASHLDGVGQLDQKRFSGQPVDWREGTDGQVLTVHGAVSNHDDLGRLIAQLHDVIRLDYAETTDALER
ncbi:ATP-grasp domain-containing protein [Microbacterium horticulturae]|uniref:ATP-grasp domain-containing protein n=1 Tax=Microbacterium horticulturae TaxID=3028316 RepID=A0ABY8BYC0_9MICO|nr:ATP-grasp domain-containing protein [Microbacterium sp. KACC 23027]WEG09173.1 ATP-grasp domain-containing protein [Microbacterium sp. KACC 23027]